MVFMKASGHFLYRHFPGHSSDISQDNAHDPFPLTTYHA